MKKLIAAIIAKWNSLPSPVRTTLKTTGVIFAGAASGVIRHAFQNPGACWTGHCLVGYTVSALHAGAIAGGAYLLHSPLEQELVDQGTNPQAPQTAQK
jgi:hypothetical protein